MLKGTACAVVDDMKRLLAFILVALLIFTGCESVSDNDKNNSDGIFDIFGDILDQQGDPTESGSDAPTEKATEAPTNKIPDDELMEEGPVFTTDPYVSVDKEDFYEDYEPAVSASDAYYRTQHGLMSGSIEQQDQEPTLADYRPVNNGSYVRNTAAIYSEDGDIYYIMNEYGVIVNKVYRDGGYVTLEEVAAYVYAFGNVPPNYTSKKSGKPASSPWGEYLRLNHSQFSGSTSKYPYEPELPDISGCGGSLYYYEIDIGTTGTDCDPAYTPAVYNNGSKITRGAARIVYTRYDANGNSIIDTNEKFVFYTYNHYNDFQEYLNYEGGWGEMFGNITGGGTLSSRTHYNPTPYVRTARADFSQFKTDSAYVCVVYIPYVEFIGREYSYCV